MKTTKTLTILVLGLLVCSAQFASAVPTGTAFTYQGQLYDDDYPANGLYDFTFKLYDASVAGNKVGTDVNVADVNVIDGYFTVELDFGAVFDGNARWLETGIRPGVLSDPYLHTTLSPRQELTATPYALYADSSNWNNLIDVPADINDGDDVGITSESDPTVLASVKDGVSWSEISSIPEDINDGDDVGGVPSGVIVMWSGLITDIPDGWALCDGTGGTPDLTSRFIRSVPNASTDPGSTGGSTNHSHGTGSYTASSHTHSYSGTTNNNTATKCQDEGGSCSHTSPATYHSHTYSGTTGSGGGGSISGTSAAADNLPPYYALAFIMKLP